MEKGERSMSIGDCSTVARSVELVAGANQNFAHHIRVLVVDDEPAAGKLLSIMLSGTSISCATTGGALEALRVLEQERFDAVVSDLRMPNVSGLELLSQIRRRFPHLAFVFTTGVEDLNVAVQAMHHGADDYLVKPLLEQTVLASLERALRKRQVEQQIENYHRNLERLVSERTEQLNRALDHIQKSYEETLQALGAAIDLRDGETGGHSRRVCSYSLEIAAALNVPEYECCSLARAAYLHDIGKLGVPDAILLKPGPLTQDEWIVMRRHVQIGFDLLKNIPFLADASEVVLSHHERFDGTGYPRGLSGCQIPLGARIFAVADAFDAITSHRPYRSASTFEVAREIIRPLAGSQFDPAVVDVFLNVPTRRWHEIARDGRHLPPPNSLAEVPMVTARPDLRAATT
jgi:response regulator RpfG family c-di-GMP phosphodiesterase